MNTSAANIDEYLQPLPAWQINNLQVFRRLIHQVNPDVTEEMKWGVPAFLYKGKVIFTMAAFKQHTKYNFILNGAILDDPEHVFNNGLDSKKSRSIDLQEGQAANMPQLESLIRQAIEKFGLR